MAISALVRARRPLLTRLTTDHLGQGQETLLTRLTTDQALDYPEVRTVS